MMRWCSSGIVEGEVLGHELFAGDLAAQQQDFVSDIRRFQRFNCGCNNQRGILPGSRDENGPTRTSNCWPFMERLAPFLGPVDALERLALNLEAEGCKRFGDELRSRPGCLACQHDA